MRILFTSPYWLNLFDFQSGQMVRLFDRPREFYGISGSEGRLVLSHSNIDCATLQCHEDYRKSPLGMLSILNGLDCTFTVPELLQPHQIECVGEFTLCTSTGHNSIVIFDSLMRQRTVYPASARWDIGPGEKRGHHFNSIHVNGGLVYVVSHNHARDSAVWIFEWPSFALVDVLPTRTEWAHNVWIEGDDLIVCNSKAGSLYSVRQKQDIWSVEGGGYVTRGLAVNDSYVIVGLSSLSPRADRKDNDSGFALIDRKTMKTLDTFVFPQNGVVHEIRLLDEPDLCHGNGILRLPTRYEGLAKSSAIGL